MSTLKQSTTTFEKASSNCFALCNLSLTSEEDVAVLLLSKLKLDAQKYDIAANKSLDNLIRTNKITYAMATSLMNDTIYAATIASELAEVAHTLFIHEDSETKRGPRSSHFG